MNSEIISAIENKMLLEFQYQGYSRIVEPHTYGEFSNGNDILVAFQIDGQSKSRIPPFWSNFQIEEIENLSISDVAFIEARPEYKRNDGRFYRIYSQL